MKHSEGQLVAFSSGRGSGVGEAAQIDRQTHQYPDHTKAEVTEVTNWPIAPAFLNNCLPHLSALLFGRPIEMALIEFALVECISEPLHAGRHDDVATRLPF